MGNRGSLHDEQGRIRRAFVGTRWIICVLQFKNRRRALMQPGRYTELFFLDEATALAAGHRPCVECQRERYLTFCEHWLTANPMLGLGATPRVDDVDRVLHAERLDVRRGTTQPVTTLAGLPSGVIVADGDRACLVQAGALRAWTPGGYGPAYGALNDRLRVLTPRSIVAAIAGGYPVQLHPSALH
jgi:hypothetical protein